MTTPHTQRESGPLDTFLDWFQVNSRWVGIGAVVVVAAAGAYWFYLQSSAIKTDKAEKALMAAKQSIAAGNPALAQNDLQALVSRYGETRAGVEGGMLLAHVDYEGGRYDDGMKVLERLAGERPAAPVRSEIFSLIGDGYAQVKKLADAARSYEKAAEATNLPNEQAFQRAKAARTFAANADSVNARRIWAVLAADSVESVASEARVRLAELNAKPIGKS